MRAVRECAGDCGDGGREIKKLDYGKFLKEQREKQKISQQALADVAGVTKMAISYWETGKRKMTIESADKVFKALNVYAVIGKKGEEEL